MMSRQRLACAAGSPLPTVLPSSTSGAVPDTAMTEPTRTAREMPTFGSYGLPLEISVLICVLVHPHVLVSCCDRYVTTRSNGSKPNAAATDGRRLELALMS